MAQPSDTLARVIAHPATGPRSPEGKAISARNSLKHGLTAKAVVVFDEDPADYEAFRQGFVDRFAPGDTVEEFLVDRIAACAWRLRRAVRVERDLFGSHGALTGRQVVLGVRTLGNAMKTNGGGTDAFAQLARHEGAVERSLLRALHALERLQAIRAGETVPVPMAVDINVMGRKG